jgi:hypothetical protein
MFVILNSKTKKPLRLICDLAESQHGLESIPFIQYSVEDEDVLNKEDTSIFTAPTQEQALKVLTHACKGFLPLEPKLIKSNESSYEVYEIIDVAVV